MNEAVASRGGGLPESLLLRVVACICLIGFAWTAWVSQSLPPPFNPVDVGPGEVPLLASIGGMACSVGLFLQAARVRGRRVEIGRPLAVFAGLLIIVTYVLAMPLAGFYLTSIIAIPLLMIAGGERRPLSLLLSSAGFVLFVYLCFELLLHIEFP